MPDEHLDRRRLPPRRPRRDPRERRRRRDVPAGPAHQRRGRPRRRTRRAWPASARRRGGCRRASSSGAPADDEFLLACPTSVLAPTLKRLSMFVLRAKCKLSDASDEIALFGVAGPAATAMLGDCRASGSGVRAPAPRRSACPTPPGVQRALLAAPVGAEVDVGAAPAMTPRRPGAGSRSRAASSRSRRRRSTASFRRWSTSSSSAASTSRRAATRARRSSRAASTAARPSAAPSSSIATRCRSRARTSSSPATASEPAGTVANAAPHPEQRGGSALVEVRLAALRRRPAPRRRRRTAASPAPRCPTPCRSTSTAPA